MSTPTVVLGIKLERRMTEAGERKRPLEPGWFQHRPNWGFAGLNHPHEQAGAPVLCWRDGPVAPGDTTVAAIQPMYPEYWREVAIGDVLYLYEGARLCGLATVCAREDLPEGPLPIDVSEAVRWSAWVHLGTPPEMWVGLDDFVSADGALALPGSTTGARLVPAHLSYVDQQELGTAMRWAANLVVDGETLQRAYGTGPDPLLAGFAGEQRWLVEEKAAGAGRLGLPVPWTDVTTENSGASSSWDSLLGELRSEVRPGHVLSGLVVEAVARCNGHCGDIILRSSDAWWRVHLTYSTTERPPWPMTERYESTLDLISTLTSGEHNFADFLE